MNRFTEDLLAIKPRSNGYVMWYDIGDISEYLMIALITGSNYPGNHDGADHEPKQNLICFVAAMSDEDLKEVFGV